VLHRITGNRPQGPFAGLSYDRVLVAIDDATQLAYVKFFAEEQQTTAIGFLRQWLWPGPTARVSIAVR